jgi:hypothetical protein
MGDEDVPWLGVVCCEPCGQFVLVGMCRESCYSFDSCPDIEVLAQDTDLSIPVEDLPSQGAFRLVADEEDRVVPILDIVN